MSEPRNCRLTLKIAPGSTKDLAFEWPKRNLGTQTISAAVWTVPSGFTESSSSISGLRTTIRLVAPSTDGAKGWLECRITTSGGESIYHRRGIEVSKDAQ